MGISMPNTQLLHKYGIDTTDVMLSDKDVDTVTLTVAQTDWKPTPKKPSTPVNVNPGDLFKGLLGDDSDDDSNP
jgi:hypothetical protein